MKQHSPNPRESTTTTLDNEFSPHNAFSRDNEFSSSDLPYLGRSKTDICFTSVDQPGNSEENGSRVTSAALSIPSTRRANYKNRLSYTELRIIERAKSDGRETKRIDYKSAISTPEVGADLRRRDFRPEALVPCWWPDDLLTSTGAQLLLSDQKRHQESLYVKLRIDRWKTLVQRKEAELNVRYHLPQTRAETARSGCCYLRKRCESAAPHVFCPRLAPGASLCMRFLRRHSMRTQIRFVGDVARKRKEHEDNRKAVANICKDERKSSQAERFRFPCRAPVWSMF